MIKFQIVNILFLLIKW